MIGVISGSMDLVDSCRGMLVLNRHTYHTTDGLGYKLPHQIDYVDLIMTMRARGATQIVAIHTVGGIHPSMGPNTIVIPEDVIDYTSGRKAVTSGLSIKHHSMENLFDQDLRRALFKELQASGYSAFYGGVMAVSQGPRLETPAEIRMMKSHGVGVVGMTAMPEAFIALQLGIPYASIALVVNHAAGLGSSHELTTESMKAQIDRFQAGIASLVLKVAGHPRTW